MFNLTVVNENVKPGGTGTVSPNIPEHIKNLQKKKISFIPLRPRSKVSRIPWTIYQTRTPTQEEVNDWAAKGWLNQIAIVCGQVSGIIVLDVDDPPLFEAWLAEQKYRIPVSPKVRTAKGYHVYLKHPGGKVKTMIRAIPGADLKGDGGYVVCPPSIHPEGGAYEWA